MITGLHNIDIALNKTGAGCTLLVDGVPLNGVRALQLESSVDGLTLLTLKMMVKRVDLMGEVNVTCMNDNVQRFELAATFPMNEQVELAVDAKHKAEREGVSEEEAVRRILESANGALLKLWATT